MTSDGWPAIRKWQTVTDSAYIHHRVYQIEGEVIARLKVKRSDSGKMTTSDQAGAEGREINWKGEKNLSLDWKPQETCKAT